jgi:hypothetical protein
MLGPQGVTVRPLPSVGGRSGCLRARRLQIGGPKSGQLSSTRMAQIAEQVGPADLVGQARAYHLGRILGGPRPAVGACGAMRSASHYVPACGHPASRSSFKR